MTDEDGVINEPIAIIGMGCRYPQAPNVDALWQLLLEGRDAIAPYPGGRFRELDAAYEETAAGSKMLATHLGGFLPDVDRFDASFFGISPREAAFIDPQQRLLLEVSWNALEDAGQVRESYQGSRTGVFTGLWTTDYENHIFRHSERPEFYLLTGGGRSTACGRISFTFGFEGPSVSVDTACSSSMVAIHLACQSLRQGECDMALAGGVNIILSTDFTRLFTNANMLANDARCKFGDQRANGFVRSEGAGMVVLKRLRDAVAAGDGIYAVIRGSSVNNDGKSSGLLVTPSREGQQNMLLEAWRQAGITGAELSYIEAHGTGTHVGDPVEVGAISDALKKAGAATPVPIGSMKSNIGHTESAAGVAGVIKAALILHHGKIPASLHHEIPNPEIDWQDGLVEVVQQTRSLPSPVAGAPRMVGASSFGLTGTNSHMVLAEHEPPFNSEAVVSARSDKPSHYLLPLSAYSSSSLIRNAENWRPFLDSRFSPAELGELCYLAGARRTLLPHRCAVIGKDAAELQAQLAALIAMEFSASVELGVVAASHVRVVFVAPGQGSQWDGMARDLLRDNRAFRESFTMCDRAIAAETGWSLIERLENPEASSFLTQIDFIQPALFAMSVALAAVWRSAGVTPGAVVGHSMGEIAAAHLAGILTLEDAAKVICRRSRLMRTLSGSGAMASVELPAAELARWLEPFAGKLSIAAENSPGTTVVAGESEALDQLLEWLELKEVFCRRIKVDVASHSLLVDPILAALADDLVGIRPEAGTLPFFSTVHGAITPGTELNAQYWVRNLRQPVRLATATAALAREGYTCFVELSPHPILVPALESTLRSVKSGADSAAAFALPSLLRGEPAWPTLLRSFGRYWIQGGALDWRTLSGHSSGPATHRLRLPDYPFERERFWPEDADSVAGRTTASRLSPLLLSRTDPANDPGVSIFAVDADLTRLSYLKDHRVGGAIVFPAAAHVEAVLEAARLLAPGKSVSLEEVSFLQALYLSESEPLELQLVIRKLPGRPENSGFSLMGRPVSSHNSEDESAEGGWTEHSSGTIHFEEQPLTPEATTAPPELGEERPDQSMQAANAHRGTREEHYRMASRSGLEYGPAFQLVESFEVSHVSNRHTAQTHIRFDDDVRMPGCLIHPALLDSCFQAMLHLRPRGAGMSLNDVYLPLHMRNLTVFGLPSKLAAGETSQLITEAVFLGADSSSATLEMQLQLKTEPGEILAVVEAMTVQRVQTRDAEATTEDLFVMGWKPLPTLPSPKPSGSAGRHWLIFADAEGDLETAGASYAAALARRHASLAGRCTLVWRGDEFRPLGAGERRIDQLGADEYEIPLGDNVALDRLLGLVTAEAGRISDVFDLWTLDEESTLRNEDDPLEGIMHGQLAASKFIPTLVQAITRAGCPNPPRLWMLTQGTQNLPDNPPSVKLAGSTVWGIGRAVSREHPELHPSLIDLNPRCDGPQEDEIESLVRLVLAEQGDSFPAEDRVAFRGKLGFAARVFPCPLPVSDDRARPLAKDESWRVEAALPRGLDQLQLRVMQGSAPQPGEVAIEIAYAGLNFIDVTKALGIYPGLDPKAPVQMGGECSGRVVALGAGVENLKVGDEVVALTPSPTRVGLLASRANIPAALVLPKPAMLTLAQAGSLPIAYLTAYYSLLELARLREGEWVLIHAGAGGVGLAAAQIALAQGARVIATASSPEKHAFLHEWGVEHVLPSRSLDFAQGVLEITGGKGVDVVLNSLSGDYIARSLDVLAPYGRFIELGKRDIYEDRRVGLKAFRHNISYFAVDLAAVIEEKPALTAAMFATVMQSIETGRWAALPVRPFPATDPAQAFQFMAQGRHIGKLALQFENLEEVRVLPSQSSSQDALFHGDATYILTGGLGGVGAAVADWMVENGAGHLVLVSRREAGPAENEVLRRVRAKGAIVEHHRTDILDFSQVRQLVSEITRTMPPLRGIMHAAAVIDDALVTNLTPDRFDAVFGPKIRGTWHLHQATLGLPLDFFVMFSSFASVFPQPGHGSYSAANSFMDAFAGYRRGLGMPASAINWAGWLGLGLARETGTSRTIEAYEAEGFGSFERDEALYLLGQVLRSDPVQVLAVRIDPDKLISAHEGVPPLFREVASLDGRNTSARTSFAAGEGFFDELQAAATYAEKLLKLETLLRTGVSRVLKLAPDRITANQPFGQMGIDSLMALEFIRRVNGVLGLALPATAVFNYPSIHALAIQIAQRLGVVPDAVPAPAPHLPSSGPHAEEFGMQADFEADVLQELSESDALRALMEPGDSTSGD
jgi:acyl transferase domain-containing protein/NADPH:quinone reductase-like Zn-dependent oxidoreductase/acyl carrier protein